MPPEVAFAVVLIAGIVFLRIAAKLKRKIKALLLIMGVLFVLFGGFGVFTSFL